MLFYTRTNAPDEILREGFRDHGTDPTSFSHGAWISDQPVDPYLGARGKSVLEVDVPAPEIVRYETERCEWQIEEQKPFRRFLESRRVLTEAETGTAAGEGWQARWAQIRASGVD